MTLANLNLLGLLYDGCGVVILGIPAFLKAKKELFAEAGSYFDYNKPQLRNSIAFRTDTAMASVMLLIGFLLQAISSAQLAIHEYGIVALWLALPLLPIVFYGKLRGSIVSTWVDDLEREYKEKQATNR